jgi:L,D-transpeptidase YcbB
VVAHSQPGYSRPPGSSLLPPGVSFASNNGFYSSGPSFFDRLFGPPTPPAPIGRRWQQQQRGWYR